MSAAMIVRGEAAAQPHKNSVRLSPGLGILQNIIIDQHFTERGRLSRLITAVSYNPRQLGLGIDENTAVIIGNDGTLEVHGHGTVTIVDGSRITTTTSRRSKTRNPSRAGVQLHTPRDCATTS